jgi:DNA invertase Pin-like site-specific DNA recombinase
MNVEPPRPAISYVRFSSRKQRFGASVERQLELTRDFCHFHNLLLDETKTIKDLGVSAFHSKNTDEGNLGAFIKGVESGVIKTPVVLAVEALDRISRDKITDAIHLFTTLLKLGVDIGLVSDKKILTKDFVDKNPVELIVATTYLIRGHDESRMKGNRTGDAVKRMLEKVKRGEPCRLGGYLPPWFRYDEEKNKFIRQPEKTKTVKSIFAHYISGMGTTAIVKAVKGLPKWNNNNAPIKAGGIKSLLRNKQVIGTLKLGGVEYPHYLEPIIDPTDFDKVQVMLDGNRTRRGKHDGRVNNLFNHHIFCGTCEGPLNCHKSASKNYFFCNNGRDYACEDRKYYPADDLERWVFGVVMKKSPSLLIAEHDTEPQRELERCETELAVLMKRMAKTVALLDDDSTSVADLKPKFADVKAKIAETEQALKRARVKVDEHRKAPANLAAFLQLVGRDLKDQETRRKIKALLPSVIKRIEVELANDVVRIQMRNGQQLGGEWMTDEQAEEAGL